MTLYGLLSEQLAFFVSDHMFSTLYFSENRGIVQAGNTPSFAVATSTQNI